MQRITNYLTQFDKTLLDPIPSVNRAFFTIARNYGSTRQEITEIQHDFLPTAAPTVPWAHNFKNVHDNHELLSNSLNADFEHLVKVMVPNGLNKGQRVTLKTNSGDAEYFIYKKIATQGLVSYALKPINPKDEPILVFRCTEPDPQKEHSFQSMQNDTDENIGERGWQAAKETFKQLMADQNFRSEGKKIKVGGYSLGGAHAQYFVAEHHEWVSHAIFFNNPSINAEVVENFAKNVKGPIILQIFRNWGDPFTHFGKKHLGCGVNHPNVNVQLLEISTPNCDRFDTKFHSKCIFKTTDFNYTVQSFTEPEILARKLDNSKQDAVTITMEALRQKHGKILSNVLGMMSSLKTGLINLITKEAGLKKAKKS